MTAPYESSQHALDASETADLIRSRRRFWLRAIWLSIAGVIAPPVIGVVCTVIGMRKAFGQLSAGGGGSGDTGVLSDSISMVLRSTAYGFVISTIAFIVLVGVLIRFFTLPKVPTRALPQNGAGSPGTQ
jgi:biopolymer transport protein ExbB/TolQ